MKIGAHAFEELGFRPHFGVSVRVRGPLERPITCMLDGLQWSTGATLGKGNITAEPAEELSVEIEARDGGTLTYRIPAQTRDRFAILIAEVGEDQATRAVWDGPLSEYCRVASGEVGAC
jgi:hypothetical protein